MVLKKLDGILTSVMDGSWLEFHKKINFFGNIDWTCREGDSGTSGYFFNTQLKIIFHILWN